MGRSGASDRVVAFIARSKISYQCLSSLAAQQASTTHHYHPNPSQHGGGKRKSTDDPKQRSIASFLTKRPRNEASHDTNDDPKSGLCLG